MLNANELLSLAIEELDKLEIDEVSSIKELFKDYSWNRFPVKERHLLWKLLLNYVNLLKKLSLANSATAKQIKLET